MQDMPEDVRLLQWAPPVEELDAMERDLDCEVWGENYEPVEEDSCEEACMSEESDVEESDVEELDPGLLERLDALEVADWAEVELNGDFVI